MFYWIVSFPPQTSSVPSHHKPKTSSTKKWT